jgi:predicted nucleic acid-binding protein
LAKELKADRLLIDERKGRRLAVQEGVPVIGLVGMVLLAKKKGLIASAGAMLDRLQEEAGMYLTDDIRNEALKSVAE